MLLVFVYGLQISQRATEPATQPLHQTDYKLAPHRGRP